MGLFKSKPKPEPIPMEERPIEYVRLPACKHRADEDCECYGWDLRMWDMDAKHLLPSRRGSTKRTMVCIEDGQSLPGSIEVCGLDGAWVADAQIPQGERQWAVSDDTRIVYQVWLVVTRIDEPGDDEDGPDYDARLRFARKGTILMFDQDDPAAMRF